MDAIITPKYVDPNKTTSACATLSTTSATVSIHSTLPSCAMGTLQQPHLIQHSLCRSVIAQPAILGARPCVVRLDRQYQMLY